MTNKIVAVQGQSVQESPFDAIARFTPDGQEYWLATELLALLGYKTWKRQQDTVERAISACRNSQQDTEFHFINVVQMAQIGGSDAFREVIRDYRLSRFGCYLTALNGDPRKTEVAQAQSYFAIKTREAEVVIPAQSDRLKELELEVKLLKMQTEIYELKEVINKKPIAGSQSVPIPQTIDSVDELSEVRRRRNLAEMEAACTPGTEEYKSAIAVRDWLNRK